MIARLLFPFIVSSLVAPATLAAQVVTYDETTAPVNAREKRAVEGFRKHAQNKVKHFSWRFVYEDAKYWVYSFEDRDVIPRPGSDYFVSVNKVTAKVSVEHGR